MPLLPDNFYVVAIDFSGHGFSSHLPPGCPYNDMIFVIEIERTVNFLGWKDKTFNIIGHSMGAAVGMFYACLFPKTVKQIISLDMIKPLTFPSDKLAEKTRESIQHFLELESKIGPELKANNKETFVDDSMRAPIYDPQDALKKLIIAHSVFGKISPEGAAILLKRGSKPSPSDPTKLYFTRDNRLKALLFQRFDNETLINYFQQLCCDLMIIKAEHGVRLDPEEVSNCYIELYKEKCSKFDLVIVPGYHHVHLCNPENVSNLIINFFKV